MTKVDVGAGESLVRWGGRSAILASFLLFSGCGSLHEPKQGGSADEDVVRTTGALETTTFDDSAAPVRVQIKVCTTDFSASHNAINCTVDSGYAVVGGGAYAQWTGPGALLTASMPLADGRTWYAESKDHVYADSHRLSAYAIGLHLDGINAATLRSQIVSASYQFPASGPGVAAPSASFSLGARTLGTGAGASTFGPGQLLTSTFASGSSGTASSKDHLVSSPGWVVGYTRSLSTQGIIEGFGALDIQRRTGTSNSVSTGVGTSTGSVSSGWALAGLGGRATNDGVGRLLFRVGPNGDTTARNVIVQSKDHAVVSAGATTVSWTEVRKTAGSHGLCNQGAKLSSGMDSCVASICAAHAHCCSTQWDAACVSEVTSRCGRSCANDTCGVPAYEPTFWNDNGVIQLNNNCYNYATNRTTQYPAQPGYASGFPDDYCHLERECNTTANILKYAIADGLIPTTLGAGCSNGRALVALAINPERSYHWYRRDADNRWSSKDGNAQATNLDLGNPPQIITNVETANRGSYTEFGGYFCTCSSASQGQGHAVILGPAP